MISHESLWHIAHYITKDSFPEQGYSEAEPAARLIELSLDGLERSVADT